MPVAFLGALGAFESSPLTVPNNPRGGRSTPPPPSVFRLRVITPRPPPSVFRLRVTAPPPLRLCFASGSPPPRQVPWVSTPPRPPGRRTLFVCFAFNMHPEKLQNESQRFCGADSQCKAGKKLFPLSVKPDARHTWEQNCSYKTFIFKVA